MKLKYCSVAIACSCFSIFAATSVSQAATNEAISPTESGFESRVSRGGGIEQILSEGWRHLEEDNAQRATQIWQDAVDEMPDDRLLLFAGVYYTETAATRRLLHLGKQHSGIMVQSEHRGRSAWYVLAAPPEDDVEEVRSTLEDYFQVGRVSGNSSQRFKRKNSSQSDALSKDASSILDSRSSRKSVPSTAPVSTPATGSVSSTVSQKSAHAVSGQRGAEQLLSDGWSAMQQDDTQAAIAAWENAINAMSAQRLLLFAGVYYSESAAARQLDRIGEQYAGIMVESKHKGRDAWYVLTVPPEGELEQSRQNLQQLLQVDRVWANRSQRFQSDGVPYARIKKRSRPKATQSPRGLYSKAKSKYKRGNVTEAMGYLSDLLEVSPEHDSGRLMYAKLLVQEGKFEKASEILPKLLQAKNPDWKPWFLMGTSDLMLNRLEDAADHFDESIVRDRFRASLWVQRAIVEQERDNNRGALGFLKIARGLNPDLPAVNLNIAYSAEALGMRSVSRKAYRRFLKQTDDNPALIQIRKKVLTSLRSTGW